MRKVAFQAVAQFFGVLIIATQWVSEKICLVYGRVGYFFMNAIDPQRLAIHVKLQNTDERDELQQQDLELKLLGSANQVRDHARENNDWTDRHTEAINAIGDALITEAGWAEENVHIYLKNLVESIDGLEYDVEEW